MAYQKHPVGVLIDAAPKQATERILTEFRKAKCSQVLAAQRLGVAESTLIRWVERLGLAPKLAAIVKTAIREGWHHGEKRGRPRKVA